MARGGRSAPPSRSSSSSSRSAPAPQRHAPPPAPAQHQSAPAPAAGGGGGMMAGLGATMAQGMAWGVGTSVAREAVGAAMGAFSGGGDKQQAPAPIAPVQQTQRAASGPCEIDQSAFMQCLNSNPGNSSQCDFYYNALQSCQSANQKF